jgi:hypothetical protein
MRKKSEEQRELDETKRRVSAGTILSFLKGSTTYSGEQQYAIDSYNQETVQNSRNMRTISRFSRSKFTCLAPWNPPQ